jgi:5-methylcytosine-specific restriction protein A
MHKDKAIIKTEYHRKVRNFRRIGKKMFLRYLKNLSQSWSLQCVYCAHAFDKKKTNFTVDHIVPLSKGGSNQIKNLAPCCVSCNQDKKNNIWKPRFEGIKLEFESNAK